MTTSRSGELSSYWAFVSYSSHDRAWARWLQRGLETYPVPRRLVGGATPAGPAPTHLRPIFRDRSELAADSDLAGKVQEALERSAFLIVICSPKAAASRWVDEEISRFRAIHGEGRILAVIVAGSPGGDHQDCFPPALRYRDAAGQRIHVEPIAADLRPGGDGRRMTLLKLVAGMLGVGLDELVRRDAQRRARQFAALAAASFAGMTVMAGLAGAAFMARNEAQRQRGQAEGLIEFMLTDLRKRLEPTGRLDLMDGIGPKALAYYSAQNPASLDDRSLARRARALKLMAEISQQRGQLAAALRGFEAAKASTAEVLARAPGDGQRVFDHAQNVFWVGEIALQRGQEARAETEFKTYLTLARRLVSLDPKRDDWQGEVEYAETALGALYIDQGRSPEAVEAFARALAVSAALVSRHPADVLQALDLANCHAWLADSFEKQGRLSQARAERLTELPIYHRILASDPTIERAGFRSVVVTRALARLDMLAGRKGAALAGFARAAADAETMLGRHRDNMDLAGEAILAELDFADALLDANRLDDAAVHDRSAADLARTALAHDPTVLEWRCDLMRARLIEAALAARRSDRASALQLDSATLAKLAAEPLVGVNTEPRWLLDRARLQTGDDLAAVGRTAEARAHWAAAADDLNGPLERYEPQLLVVLARADKRVGRTAAARAVAARLSALIPTPGSWSKVHAAE